MLFYLVLDNVPTAAASADRLHLELTREFRHYIQQRCLSGAATGPLQPRDKPRDECNVHYVHDRFSRND